MKTMTCANIYFPAYLVELWPFAERARGISWFQLFGRSAGFFTTFVNPIGLEKAGWKYFIMYCCILVFEIAFVALFFPETSGRTLEELAFCTFLVLLVRYLLTPGNSVRGQGSHGGGEQGRSEGG